MANIKLKGNEINTIGNLPKVGEMAPKFTLTAGDLSEKNCYDFAGKKVVLNIFPSLDTEICATSVRKFNQEVSSMNNTVVLCISRDLPFAQGRFCTTNGLEKVIPLSEMRDSKFSTDYGVMITDGPLKGLMSRAVVVVDEKGKVIYTEQVEEIAQEPNYKAVVDIIKK